MKTYAKKLGEAKNLSYIYGINKIDNINKTKPTWQRKLE